MSRFGLEIRSAAPADAGGLVELLRSAGRTCDPAKLGEQIEVVRRHGGSVLLAVELGPPSGVIAFSRYATLERPGLTAQITSLLVAPDARRRGIARMLLKSASQIARQWGCDRLLLAGDGSGDIRAFCEATGFEQAGGLHARPLRRRS